MFNVTLAGYSFEDDMLTFNLASGIVAADVGKAVSVDTSAANTVKLAGDGDEIIGRLETVENRTQEGSLVGAVALRFMQLLPIKSGETVAIGDALIGAGAGEVKAQPTAVVLTDSGTDTVSVAVPKARCRSWEIVGGYVAASLI
jgi:hypothetical protein